MRHLPPAARWLVLGVMRFAQHEQWVISGYLAYSAMLALLPFLIFATALTGHLVGPEGSTEALELMFDAVPEHVAKTLEPVVIEVTSRPSQGILTLAALGSIWAASNGIEAVRVGLNRAYEYNIERHLVLNRLMALGIVLVGFVTFAVLSALIIFAPLAIQLLQGTFKIDVPRAVEYARYAVAFAVLFVYIYLMHRLLPARRMRDFRLWPGILVSAVLWIGIASGLSIYLANVQDYTITYGTLAGVIITLLFLYMSGATLVLGAEVNAAANIEHLRPGDPSEGGPEEGIEELAAALGRDTEV